MKNKLLLKIIKLKDADIKNKAHFKYKQYKNRLSTLLKRSKQSYFTNYFSTNINDLILKSINPNPIDDLILQS